MNKLTMTYHGTYRNQIPSEVSDDPYCRHRGCKEHDSDHIVVGKFDPYKQVMEVLYQLCPSEWEAMERFGNAAGNNEMDEFLPTDLAEAETAAMEAKAGA